MPRGWRPLACPSSTCGETTGTTASRTTTSGGAPASSGCAAWALAWSHARVCEDGGEGAAGEPRPNGHAPQQQQQQEEFPQPEEEPQPPQQQGQRWGGWASKMPSLSNGQSTPNAGAARGQPQPGTQSRSGGQPAGKTNAAPAKSTGFGGLFASSPLSSGQSTPNAAATRGQPQQGKRSRPVGQPTGVGWLAMSRGQSTPNTAAARGQPRSGGFQNPGQMQRPPQQMQRPPQQMQRPRKTRRFM
mmetsp:Transcript_28049/g.80495  ORF Transcript_28049/g.80495 Transcript_28049/m.80495 type:complete len:244 (+) Transcript_28049:890-1621(+)